MDKDTIYPYEFHVYGGWFRWCVLVCDTRRLITHYAVGPFYSKVTAERVRQGLTQFYRTGYDMGQKDALKHKDGQP